ncbi:MAG: polysaccharide deacetylase family protein [Patescibacteria group bacterium]|nr:polysaccharide deacetylase family protein [Patescibacteria group bacterium]
MRYSNVKTRLNILFIFAFLSLTLFALAKPSSAYSSDTLINTSFEEQGTSVGKAYDWQDFMGGYTRTNNSKTGSWGITLRNSSDTGFSGAYQRLDLNQTSIKPVFIGGYVKGEKISNTSSWYGASIYAEIHLTSGKVVYWNSLSNTGTFDWRWIGFNTGILSEIDAPISHIFIVPILGNSKGTAHFDDLTAIEHTPTEGAVTFMFDDGEATTYSVAYPILKSKNWPGVIGVVTNFVGNSGFMRRVQLTELQNNGWEIVSHSISHNDLTTMTNSRAQKEIALSKERLTSWGFRVNSFAFPYGAYNANLLAFGSSIYASMRPYEIGDNPKGSWPYQIRVRSITNTTTPQQVKKWAEESKTKGTWNIFTFHSLDTIEDDEYRTDPNTFAQMVNEVYNVNIPVVTYQEGLNRFAQKR